MSTNGFVRKMDDLGRVVLPKDIRDSNGWGMGTEFEIVVTEDGVLFKPFRLNHQCYICGDQSKLVLVKDRSLCKDCLDQANKKKPIE